MENLDTQEIQEINEYDGDDHEMFMRHIADDDHELLFLDSYLRDTFVRSEKESTI